MAGHDRSRYRLHRLAQRKHGAQAGTLAFYGPTDTFASKAVASVIGPAGAEPLAMRKWLIADTAPDIRENTFVLEEILSFFAAHQIYLCWKPRRLSGSGGNRARRMGTSIAV